MSPPAYPRPRPRKCNEPTPSAAPILARCSLPADHTMPEHHAGTQTLVVRWPVK